MKELYTKTKDAIDRQHTLRQGQLWCQRAKKVVSDSPVPVDFATGLVNSVLNLPDGPVKYFEEFNLQKKSEINSGQQKIWGAS